MSILDKTINSLVIMYSGAMYDCFMTLWGLYYTNGQEANPIFNWMKPPYMIPAVAASFFVIGMSGMIILLLLLDYIASKYNRDQTKTISFLNKAILFAGVWHFCTGSSWLIL